MIQPSRHPVDERLPLARLGALGLQHALVMYVVDAARADAATCPHTRFSQNVGLVAVTGVKSRWVCVAGGCIMIVPGILPTAVAAVARNLFFNGTRVIPAASHGDAGAANNHPTIVQGSKA